MKNKKWYGLTAYLHKYGRPTQSGFYENVEEALETFNKHYRQTGGDYKEAIKKVELVHGILIYDEVVLALQRYFNKNLNKRE